MKGMLRKILPLSVLLSCWAVPVLADELTDTRPGVTPDVRDDDSSLTVQDGNLVVVPIPMSNPTLDTGLILGEAYYHPQTQKQADTQPASVTAVAGMYTNSDSKALAVMHQGYWLENRWRFSVAAGAADLRLSLVRPDFGINENNVDWNLKGHFLQAGISRKIAGDWYLGILSRYIKADQSIDFNFPDLEFDLSNTVTSAGLGALVEYDTRDMPSNSYSGRHFRVEGLFNSEALGSNKTYQSYKAFYHSYHTITDSLVLAWELRGCDRSGNVPLWEGCMISLRGFSATNYIGMSSLSGQAEARLRLNNHWGLVGFGGLGYITTSFNGEHGRQGIPSYGVGVRFMVLPAKRINIRVDYGRSTDSDALHLSVSEAF